MTYSSEKLRKLIEEMKQGESESPNTLVILYSRSIRRDLEEILDEMNRESVEEYSGDALTPEIPGAGITSINITVDPTVTSRGYSSQEIADMISKNLRGRSF